jgi:hypothetical protein
MPATSVSGCAFCVHRSVSGLLLYSVLVCVCCLLSTASLVIVKVTPAMLSLGHRLLRIQRVKVLKIATAQHICFAACGHAVDARLPGRSFPMAPGDMAQPQGGGEALEWAWWDLLAK